MADYKYSPYYKNVDVYNLKSTTRIVLEITRAFSRLEYTCGVTSMLSVLEWFGMRGDMNEIDLAKLRNKTGRSAGHNDSGDAECHRAAPGEWEVFSSYDIVEGDSEFECGIEVDGEYIDLGEMIPYFLSKGIPVMVNGHEWGGHYQVVIGYDDMGTEGTCDDVIPADGSYDTTDHNQDGYVIRVLREIDLRLGQQL